MNGTSVVPEFVEETFPIFVLVVLSETADSHSF